MKKLLLALSVIILAACGNEDNAVTKPTIQTSTKRMLNVKLSSTTLLSGDANSQETLGTEGETTTETLSTFRMSYGGLWYNDFEKVNGKWNPVEWPSDVDNVTPIDFYANDGGTFVWNNGNPYVSFTMDENAFTQKDFLVATHKQISYNEKRGAVSLAFNHACAIVQFKVFKEGDADYTVNSIKLKNVKKTGDYYYNESTNWQNIGTPTDYTLTNGDIVVTNDKQLLPSKWLFIIPQSKDEITIEVNYNADQQKIINLTGSWEANKLYTISIKI